ncbi:MAG: M43 family zinc metalloprotease [Crocinitomicaceae bacterium]|nr:M43 family zinc metalloprotease [Crocinitomicaceae bacterium]
MKKNYTLSALMVIGGFLSFGQNNTAPTTLTPASQTSQQNLQQTIQSDGLTRALIVDPGSSVSVSTTPPPAFIPGGEHTCRTHELNQQHYAERGLLQQFNDDYMQSAMATSGAIPKTSGVNEISVIFHVVYNPSTPGSNVSSALIMQVWQDLTDDYQLLNSNASNARTATYGFTPSNPNINFCLATQDEAGAPLLEMGVVRVSTTEDWYDSDNGEENKMKASATNGSEIWDRNKYLNIWICDISTGTQNPNSGTAGYAYRPSPTFLPSASIDGIVLDFNLGMNNENVLTHEVGHYLGLDHTWGGSGGCTGDDGFGDTPFTSGPSRTTPTSATSTSCSGFQETCSGVQTQYENYMDYSNCTVMFTQDQSNYMLSILQGIRGSLLLSPGCDPTNTPPISAFTSVPLPSPPVIIPQNASVSLYDQSTNVPTGWTWTISGAQGVDWAWVNTTTANSQDPVAEFYTVGLYDVTLTASNAYGPDLTPAIEIGYISVAAAATGIACDTLRNWDTAAGAGPVTWTLPSLGYVHGNSEIGGDAALEWAEVYTVPAVTDIRAIEFAATAVSDAGGSVIFKVWADNGGEPAAVPITTETVLLADITAGSWNNIELTTPAVGVVGTIWVGYELSYNSTDTLALFSQIGPVAANTTSWRSTANGWEDIGTTTGGGAGVWGLIDVLTSTGPAPTMDFAASGDTVCVGGDIIVDGSMSTNNSDYRWYVTDDPWVTSLETSSSSSNTFNFPYAPGTYNVYLFGSASCLSSGVFMPLEVFAAVGATVTPTATTCGNNNGSIDVTAPTGGDGTYYYSLDGVTYQVGSSFTGLAPGDYDVFVATLGDNCYYMETVTVATSTPGTGTASANQSVCPGETASITASGGIVYVWTDGVTNLGVTATINVTPTNTTQYACLVTDGTGCQATVYTTVTVNTPIQPVITPSAASACDGSTVDLVSSAGFGNVWSTTETSSTITVSTAGPFTVTAPDANGCSATSDPINITIIPAPSIGTASPVNPSSCGGTNGSIQITGSGTGNIVWGGTASGSASSITLPYTASGLGSGSYQFTFTDGNGCVSNIASESITDPNPPTTPTIAANGPITFCQGGSVDLTSSYGSGNVWSSTAITPSITVTSTGIYSVTYTDGSGCSATSATVTVTVNTNPSAPTIAANGSTTLCTGESVDLSSSQGTGNVWSTTEISQTINVSTAGPYSVIYTDANGCTATSATTTIVVNALPTVDAGADQTLCEGGDVILNGSGALTYVWDMVTDGVPFTPAAGTTPHTVTGTDANGCSNTDQVDVIVNVLPTVTFSALSDICVNYAATTLVEGTPAGGTYTGTGVSGGQFDPASAGTGTHTLTYEYTDGNGCTNTATSDIFVDGCISVDEIDGIEVIVFPNPMDNKLTIEIPGDFSYEIVDARGRIIERGNSNDSVTTSTANYEAGVYFVNIQGENLSTTTRVVKK